MSAMVVIVATLLPLIAVICLDRWTLRVRLLRHGATIEWIKSSFPRELADQVIPPPDRQGWMIQYTRQRSRYTVICASGLFCRFRPVRKIT
ncbi:MAG: hypothetical protein AAF823_01985 [Planctomycetota bacterium]